ncbi:BglG family transcription antiterminator [Rossellomorea sp. BNER]|uniref:BglG family transcription antiterminator n=1 Tax=Rossellomorea sp. BNER TaxID=2962031 RepID=UPI003AF27A11|nr:BglG family transcription antiterminator [Rossellomorea sp. BNER]
MNKRQKEILRILLTETEEPLLVQDLANKLDCSEKTIRNDLKVMEKYIGSHTTGSLIRKPGLGVYLEINQNEKTTLFHELHLSQGHDDNTSDEKRILEIAYELLMNPQPLSSQKLAEEHYVTKTTIRKDLDRIESWLREVGLELVSKQKVGLHIEGSEHLRRKALSRLSLLVHNSSFSHQFISEKFSSYEVDIVKSELKTLQKKNSLYFTDETMESLLIHTLFTIRRTKLKRPITISTQEKEEIINRPEFRWAEELLKKLGVIFVVHFSEEEIVYLALHLLGGKLRLQQGSHDTGDGPVLTDIIHKLTNRMSSLMNVDFKKDRTLIEGLHVHLYSTLNRLKFNLNVSNPMLHDIKRMYPYMFNMVIEGINEINGSFSLSIPEEEAAYLTLHFQASLERLTHMRNKVRNVIIVCHMGVGMSQLLRTKLEKRYDSLNILGCISKSDIEDYLSQHSVDLVISTVELRPLKVPTIVISPLLDRGEEKKLEKFLSEMDHPKQSHRFSTLMKYMDPSLIFIDKQSDHRYKLIEEMATALYKKGYVEKDYVFSAVQRERMSSTSIGSGIAIPHGSPNFINKSVVAVSTLKEALEWGNEKVNLIFMIAVKNEGQESKLLFQELSNISESPAFIRELVEADDAEGFLSKLKKGEVE